MKYALPSKLHGKRLLPLAGLLLASFHASAFDCVESGTNVVDKPPIDIGELAIPANVPNKTKVWESTPITVTAFVIITFRAKLTTSPSISTLNQNRWVRG